MFVGDAVRFVTSTVDARLVTPVANRLANSVANPYVLSYVLWDRIKKLTPQRARDLTRLLSTAVANGIGVLGAAEAQRLAGSTRKLQDHLIAASVTREGKHVVLNSVATASKVAQALNTPETKIATQQLFETLQSFVDFFASTPGRNVIATAGECVTSVCEVLASPESAVLLAEVATNLCHALEVEALRREAEEAAKAERAHAQQERADETDETLFAAEEDKGMDARSSLSSAEDTAFETESEFSLPSRTTTPAMGFFGASDHHRHGPHDHHEYRREDPRDVLHRELVRETDAELGARPKEPSAMRSARIEKDVLLKMGVNPSMLEEVQRIVDRLRDEQEREQAAASASIIPEEREEDIATDQEDSEISNAFGFSSSDLPLETESSTAAAPDTKTGEEEDGVILPEWHPEPVRAALRRRHVAAGESAANRHTFEDQSREMTELLARRQVAHGDLAPADVIACRVISQIIVVAFTLLVFVMFISICRYMLA